MTRAATPRPSTRPPVGTATLRRSAEPATPGPSTGPSTGPSAGAATPGPSAGAAATPGRAVITKEGSSPC